jgi:FlaA1/EpsC-like NDP-sugar epimerase
VETSETALYNIYQEILTETSDKDSLIEVIPILCSISEKTKMTQLMEQFNVRTVYHAAAYKHVNIIEGNVISGIENNVFGTLALLKSSINACVESFVLISSDKAVKPTNFMGASKRLAELICLSHSKLSKKTCISLVRFGNVFESSGSVIPLFRKQILMGGPITVTDINVNRFFMSIPEAAQLVIQSSALANNGDIHVLDMGKPIKIIDIAIRLSNLYGLRPYWKTETENQNGDIEIVFTGLKPGEKLSEELFNSSKTFETSHSSIWLSNEQSMDRNRLSYYLKNLKEGCHKNDSKAVLNTLNQIPDMHINIDQVNDVMTKNKSYNSRTKA